MALLTSEESPQTRTTIESAKSSVEACRTRQAVDALVRTSAGVAGLAILVLSLLSRRGDHSEAPIGLAPLLLAARLQLERLPLRKMTRCPITERQRKHHEQRLAVMKKYESTLSSLGATVEDGWNNSGDFRLELGHIKAEKMDALVAALRSIIAERD